jgi:regulator of sigma E protease
MNIIFTILGLLIVLGIVVFVHELGHYLAARIAGVKVEAFAIGFRPILRWKDKRGTEWRLGWVPFGGYCNVYGQDMMFNRKEYEALPKEKKKGHYLSVSAWRQALIIAGGVIMNFALAFVIYFGIAWARPQTVQLPVIGQVIQDSPAYVAGVRAGDTVVRIDGAKISNWGDLLIAKELAGKKDADVILVRGENLVDVKISSAERWGLVADGARTEIQKKNVWQAGIAGARTTWKQSKILVIVLKQIITGERSSKQLGSFIMIAQVSGQALATGFVALLSIIALLSVNLGVINLLPLPVLDGGYLMVLAVEGVSRRKMQGKTMEYVWIGGWVLIGLLFALTMKNDIFRILGI